MSDVIYAIKMYDVTYPGIQIMDVKIGKTTDIKRTKRQYRRGNREIEVLDLWQPNPHKNLSTGEKGVHDIAEKYAYERESEKFVFLQGKYQQFSETVQMSQLEMLVAPAMTSQAPLQLQSRYWTAQKMSITGPIHSRPQQHRYSTA